MENKTISNLLFAGLGLVIATAIFEPSMDYSTAENLYGISGIVIIVFGIWGGIRLRKS